MKTLKSLSLKQWQTRVREADEERGEWLTRGRRFVGYYEGAHGAVSGGSVQVNTLYKDVKTTLPSIFSRLPDLLVFPKRTDAKPMAEIAKILLKYYLHELSFVRTILRCLLDTKLYGQGVVKLGWSLVMAQQQLSPEEFEKLDDKERAGLLKTGKEGYTQETIQENEPWGLRWSPEDFVVDPNATSPDLQDARWIAYRKVMNRAEAEAEFTFTAKTYRMKKGRESPDHQTLILWDVYDRLRQERRVFFEGEEFERKEPWEFEVDGFPCETLFFNEIPDWPYGEPDVRYYEPQLIEKNDIRTQQMQHRRRFNTQTLYEQSAIKDTEVAKAERNIEASWIKLLPGGSGKIIPKPIPNLPSDVYAGERLIDQDLNEMIGFSETQRGSQSQREQTATETSIIEARSRLRSGERQQAMEIFLARLMEKLWMMLRQRLPRHRVEEILGRPVSEWENISGEDARKELLIQIVANSTMPKLDRLTRAQSDIQLIGMLVQWAPILQTQGTQINLKPLLEELFELLDHKVQAEDLLVPAPPGPGTMTPAIGGALGGSPPAVNGGKPTPAEGIGRAFA